MNSGYTPTRAVTLFGSESLLLQHKFNSGNGIRRAIRCCYSRYWRSMLIYRGS